MPTLPLKDGTLHSVSLYGIDAKTPRGQIFIEVVGDVSPDELLQSLQSIAGKHQQESAQTHTATASL